MSFEEIEFSEYADSYELLIAYRNRLTFLVITKYTKEIMFDNIRNEFLIYFNDQKAMIRLEKTLLFAGVEYRMDYDMNEKSYWISFNLNDLQSIKFIKNNPKAYNSSVYDKICMDEMEVNE